MAMAPPTILIVDDVPLNAELVQSVLNAEGFRTLTAHDGQSARAISREQRPDLILLDVLMPGESGFETCAQLKSEPSTADIPIIFLSALDDVQNKVHGLKIGGVDYISKPVHGEEVLARVRVHLRISQNNRLLVEAQRGRLEQLRDAQRAILTQPADIPAAAFAVHYEPLEEAGGDFYDVLEIDMGVFGYFVADVSGHGASAAFLTSAMKALLRQYAGPLFSPEDTMRGVDSVMRQVLGEEQYFTALYARLNRRTRQLSVVSAGHPPLIRVTEMGKAEVVEMDSQPLGIFSSTVLQRKDLRVSRGDRLYLYSDGLIESTPGGNRRAGLDSLIEACVRFRPEPLAQGVTQVVERIRSGRQRCEDDWLLLGVEAFP
jgi:phosphoserine phosphatase RsbU/P